MDFNFTDEQEMLRDTISKFVAKEYAFEQRGAVLANENAWKATWATVAELGLLALPVPEEFGGLGGGPVDTLVAMEEFGKALLVAPFLQTAVIGAGFLRHAGAPAQKEEHFPALARGERVFSFAYAEPQARYNLANVTTRARKDGAGYLLDGRKAVAIGAPQADYLILTARTGGSQREAGGVSVFIAPKNAKGIITRDYQTVDGFRASEIHLEGAALGLEHLIGAEGEALPLIEQVTDEAIAALCAEACGAMRQLNALTLDYARARRQFGAAIGSFQVLQHRLVDMFIETEKSVSMAYMATLKLGAPAPERARAASAAKAKIAVAGRFVGQNAVQIHGGMGMADEMSVSHYFKRLTMIGGQFGDAAHHTNRYKRLSLAMEPGEDAHGC